MLNVRDYGYHNYDYRVIEGGTAKYVVNSYPETKYYKDKKGRQYRKEGITTVYRVLTYYTHLCVCGSGYSDTDYYDDPVFTPNN